MAAKHGVVGLTQNAALEHAADHIRVNAVGPGYIRTPLLDANLDEAALTAIAALHPIGRLGTSEEVAELVAWLAGDASSFVTSPAATTQSTAATWLGEPGVAVGSIPDERAPSARAEVHRARLR